jgi:hypothetical protein
MFNYFNKNNQKFIYKKASKIEAASEKPELSKNQILIETFQRIRPEVKSPALIFASAQEDDNKELLKRLNKIALEYSKKTGMEISKIASSDKKMLEAISYYEKTKVKVEKILPKSKQAIAAIKEEIPIVSEQLRQAILDLETAKKEKKEGSVIVTTQDGSPLTITLVNSTYYVAYKGEKTNFIKIDAIKKEYKEILNQAITVRFERDIIQSGAVV